MKRKNNKRKVRKISNRNTDFFGIGKSPSYLGGKSRKNFLNSSIPFLNSKNKLLKQRSLKQRLKIKQKKIPFFKLDNPPKSIKKYVPKQKRLNWNYKRIKKKFPNFNPYGDADMDGSMNYKDCKPFDASRDGKITEKIKGLFKKKERKESLLKTGAGVRALSRKLLYKKAPITKKGKVVGHKTILRGGKPVSTKILKAVALTGVPVKVPKDKSKKEGKTYDRPGRPKGPSGKYVIPGKGPVYEHEYRKWETKQRALARIQTEQARGIPQEDLSEVPGGEEMEEDEEMEETEEPKKLTPEQIYRLRQIQQARSRQSQLPRASSQTAGGPVADHILNAPNIARGELRTSQSGQPIPTVRLSERPQANPTGEYYTNIDPMTGKQIMQRRVSEKFATGEAL